MPNKKHTVSDQKRKAKYARQFLRTAKNKAKRIAKQKK